MSNTVIIKHGTNPPIDANLQKHELGYAESDKGLYIKNEAGEVVQLNDTSQIEQKIEDLSSKVESTSGIVVGDTPPDNTGALWIDTTDDGTGDTSGVSKYYDETSGTWVPTAATWG